MAWCEDCPRASDWHYFVTAETTFILKHIPEPTPGETLFRTVQDWIAENERPPGNETAATESVAAVIDGPLKGDASDGGLPPARNVCSPSRSW